MGLRTSLTNIFRSTSAGNTATPRPDGPSPKRPARDKPWFDRGGRHGLANRISDIGPWISSASGLGNVVDIGAAEGDIARWLSEHARHVHAMECFDQLYESLARALDPIAQCTAEQADILQSPLAMEYDVVFLLGVLHYFDDPEQRRQVIEHCLSHATWAFVTRTAVREFKMERHGYEPKPNHLSLRELEAIDPGDFEVYVRNNCNRPDDQRLGDLILYYRPGDGNPLAHPTTLISDLVPLSDARPISRA